MLQEREPFHGALAARTASSTILRPAMQSTQKRRRRAGRVPPRLGAKSPLRRGPEERLLPHNTPSP